MSEDGISNEAWTPVRLNIGLEQRGVPEGAELYVHQDNDIVSYCIRHLREWEIIETRYILDQVKADQIVLDLGANLGYYTVIFGKLVGPGGQVIAFEPDDRNFELLTKNIAHNQLGNVQVMKAIVGDAPGVALLNEYVSEQDTNRGAHTVIEVGIPNFTKKTMHPRITLDDMMQAGVDRVDFLKIDTQGSEPLIVKGGADLIRANAKHLRMVMEFTPSWITAVTGAHPREFYREVLDMGFDGFFIDLKGQSVKPLDDLDALLEIVHACDGESWPKGMSFVDLVFEPR